ncbi:MAG: hypothetical protein R6V04_07760 [bacterium]
MKSIEVKYHNVIKNNTFYYFDEKFEENYEKHIFSVKESIIHLKNEVKNYGCKKEVFEKFLKNKKELGLKALLAITGFSNESLKRLITVIRIIDNKKVEEFTYKNKWINQTGKIILGNNEISEWSTSKIENLVRNNEYFRKALVNIFYDGSSLDYFQKSLPPFEFQKFSLEKLNFDINAIIDTLARYKEKGSRAAKCKNNPETLIETILNKNNISFLKGDLGELIKNAPDKKRTMDFIIPDIQNPKIIIESSYLVTTSSGQGDKSKTEISIDTLIKSHYPETKFIGFVDGIGWYVRKKDLKRMVGAYEDVFTFHKNELERFEEFIKEIF